MQTTAASPNKAPGYKLIDGQVFRHLWNPTELSDTEPGRAWKRCVPTGSRNKILSVNHDSVKAGHLGIAKTLNRLALRYYWLGMFRDAANYVHRCQSCLKYIVSQRAPAGNMGPQKPSPGIQ